MLQLAPQIPKRAPVVDIGYSSNKKISFACLEDGTDMKAKCLHTNGFFVLDGLEIATVDSDQKITKTGQRIAAITWLQDRTTFTLTYKDTFYCRVCCKTHQCGSKKFNEIISSKKIENFTLRKHNFKKTYELIASQPRFFVPYKPDDPQSSVCIPMKVGSTMEEVREKLSGDGIELSEGDTKGVYYCRKCGRHQWNITLYYIDREDLEILADTYKKKPKLINSYTNPVLWAWMEGIYRSLDCAEDEILPDRSTREKFTFDHVDKKLLSVMAPKVLDSLKGIASDTRSVPSDSGEDIFANFPVVSSSIPAALLSSGSDRSGTTDSEMNEYISTTLIKSENDDYRECKPSEVSPVLPSLSTTSSSSSSNQMKPTLDSLIWTPNIAQMMTGQQQPPLPVPGRVLSSSSQPFSQGNLLSGPHSLLSSHSFLTTNSQSLFPSQSLLTSQPLTSAHPLLGSNPLLSPQLSSNMNPGPSTRSSQGPSSNTEALSAPRPLAQQDYHGLFGKIPGYAVKSWEDWMGYYVVKSPKVEHDAANHSKTKRRSTSVKKLNDGTIDALNLMAFYASRENAPWEGGDGDGGGSEGTDGTLTEGANGSGSGSGGGNGNPPVLCLTNNLNSIAWIPADFQAPVERSTLDNKSSGNGNPFSITSLQKMDNDAKSKETSYSQNAVELWPGSLASSHSRQQLSIMNSIVENAAAMNPGNKPLRRKSMSKKALSMALRREALSDPQYLFMNAQLPTPGNAQGFAPMGFHEIVSRHMDNYAGSVDVEQPQEKRSRVAAPDLSTATGGMSSRAQMGGFGLMKGPNDSPSDYFNINWKQNQQQQKQQQGLQQQQQQQQQPQQEDENFSIDEMLVINTLTHLGGQPSAL